MSGSTGHFRRAGRQAPDPEGGTASGAVDEWFRRGVELIRRGAYFEAHEELELAWRAADEAERDFFQGLVHFTVAWYQAGRGNKVGCERQLAKASRRLGPYAPRHRAVDVAAILTQLAEASSTVESGSLQLEPARL